MPLDGGGPKPDDGRGANAPASDGGAAGGGVEGVACIGIVAAIGRDGGGATGAVAGPMYIGAIGPFPGAKGVGAIIVGAKAFAGCAGALGR